MRDDADRSARVAKGTSIRFRNFLCKLHLSRQPVAQERLRAPTKPMARWRVVSDDSGPRDQTALSRLLAQHHPVRLRWYLGCDKSLSRLVWAYAASSVCLRTTTALTVVVQGAKGGKVGCKAAWSLVFLRTFQQRYRSTARLVEAFSFDVA